MPGNHKTSHFKNSLSSLIVLVENLTTFTLKEEEYIIGAIRKTIYLHRHYSICY